MFFNINIQLYEKNSQNFEIDWIILIHIIYFDKKKNK